MAPPPPETGREIMLVFSMILVVVFVLVTLVWLRESVRKPLGRGRKAMGLRAATTIILGCLLAGSIFSIYIYEERESPPWPGTYEITIKVAGSSANLDIIDFWLHTDANSSRHWPFEDSRQDLKIMSIGYFDMDKLATIYLVCNSTPVFWGNSTWVLNALVSNNRALIYYRNESGIYDVYETVGTQQVFNPPYPSNDYTFSYGLSWVRLEVTVMPGPVDP